MGYYTDFELCITDTRDKDNEYVGNKTIKQAVCDYVVAGSFDYPIDDLLRNGYAHWKWYDCKDDMRKISKAFPHWLFTLSGDGEESHDLWKNYFLNGKMQEANAVVTYEDFSPDKLE